MIKFTKRLWRAIRKLWKRRNQKGFKAKGLNLPEWLTLIAAVVVAGGVSVFAINYKIKSDKAAKYDEVINKPTAVSSVVDDVTFTATVEEEDKKKALEDLEVAIGLSKNLAPIKIIETPISVTHTAEIGNKNGKKWAIMKQKAPAICTGYVETSGIEFELDSENEIIGYIDRPTIPAENIRRDTNVDPIVLRHPTAGITEKYKEKNELITFWKTEIDNDDAKGFVTKKDVAELERKWSTTFNPYAYEVAKKELFSNEKYMKKLDKAAIDKLTNVYNPDVKIKIDSKKDGEVKTVNLPNNTRVKFRFKDERK